MTSNNLDITIVIPLFNEEESLKELEAWIRKVMQNNHYTYEIIMVDDGSQDSSWDIIEQLAKENSCVKGIKFRRNYGKAAALFCGFKTAQGEIVITMDADLQDNPEEIPALYKMIKEENFDLVSGWKKIRHDPKLTKNIPSKFYNWTVRRMSGVKLHDMNCGLKAYKKKVVKSIEVYGEMHRYIPVLAKWAGFNKIGEKVVIHQERKYGNTKYGWNRFIRGPLDLLSVMFISKFGKRPMHFFGALGSIMFLIGFIIAAWLGANKLYCVFHGMRARLVTDNAFFYIALTTMIIGTQLFLAGFTGELVSRSASERNNYLIDKEI